MATRPRRAEVHYTLGWKNPNDHLFDITITFRARDRETALDLPSWRPGRYLVQNYAANIREWWAEDAKGNPLAVEKIDKSAWLVRSDRGERVTFGYRFFAGQLDAGSSYVDQYEAYFNGSNLFMMVAKHRKASHSLELKVPRGWSVETQLERRGNLFFARDYDYLIDSPTIVSPSMQKYSFEESGATIDLVFQNQKGIELRQFVAPVKKIVRAHAAMFGGMPTDHYRFLYHIGDRWHGVEHEDSCSIIAKRVDLRGAKKDDEGYDHFLAITSHEFFHLWNIKRIMPARFLPYDYSRETPTRLLWVMEGVTSYYGERTILRANLWTPEQYLEHLASEIATLESIPGRKFLSLSQASFDGWLQDPSQMHDKSNAWISFYNKGEIVAALLDIEIRWQTRGRKSLDDVMRDFWFKYGARGKGMEEDAMLRAVERVTRREFGEFFAKYVDGTDALPYEDIFAKAGIDFSRKKVRPEKTSLGAKVSGSGRLVVESVRSGSPAAVSGLLKGDEIVAINDVRVADTNALDRTLESLEPGRRVRVVYSRDDVLGATIATLEDDPSFEIALAILAKADDAARARRREWLGIRD